jgi:hypothetical protein
MADVKIGKAKISVTSHGCIDCGTWYSSRWKVVKTVPVTIGKRMHQVEIACCADCLKQRPRRERNVIATETLRTNV